MSDRHELQGEILEYLRERLTRLGKTLGRIVESAGVKKTWSWLPMKDAPKAAVTDEYAESVGLYGSPERIAERIGRYRAAGIDELVIELRKPDLADQLDDLRGFCKALTS